MKSKRFNLRRAAVLIALAGLCMPPAISAQVYKDDNEDALNLGSSWKAGVPPGAADVATWDSLVSVDNTTDLGGDLIWSGISITNPGGPVTINGANTLTLGTDGIGLLASAPPLTLNAAVVLGDAQAWNVASGSTLNVNGVISGSGALSKSGSGNLVLGGDQSNTFTSPFVYDTTGTGTSTSTLFGKTGGALALPANSILTFGNGANGQANLRMMESDQFGAGAMIDFVNPSGSWGRFDLMGTNQTLGGLKAGTPATTVNAGAVIQNREISGSASHGLSVLTLDVNTTDPNYPVGGYHFNGYIRDADSGDNSANRLALVKDGDGIQALSGNQLGYEGGTTVNGGILDYITGNAMDNARGGWTINEGGMLRAVVAHNVYGGITLNGGELAGSGTPHATYGHLVLQGNVTVGGTATSKISADCRIGGNNDRTFNVGATGDPSGIDLDFITGTTSTGRLGHLNNNTWGYMTKTGPGTLRFNNPGDIGRITNNEGKIIFNESFGGMGNGGLINNASVDIINSGDLIHGNPIHGDGSIVKTGAGMLTLTNTGSSYSGSFEIAEGDLTIGNDSGTLNLAGDISGPGSLTKDGGGTLVLTGALNHTGGTNVTGGILSVPGAFDENLTVGNGAGLIGGDSITSLSLDDGNYYSTGTPMEVTGNLSLAGDNWVYLDSPPALGTGDILIMTYGGTLTGDGSNLSFPEAVNYRGTPAFTAAAGEVKLTGLEFKDLTWTGATDGVWDILTTANWNDGTGPDTFATGDAVTFDDSGLLKTVTIPAPVAPSAITFTNSVGNDYTVSGSPITTVGTTIVKDGTGTVTFGGTNTFTGSTTINGGIFRPSTNQAFGANGNTVTVAAGATLDTNGAMNANRDYHAFIAGTGTDGSGAIVNTGGQHQNAFGIITLTDDATIGGTARWDLRPAIPNGGLLELDTHTLTKAGSNYIAIVDAQVTGSGDIDIDSGTLSFTRSYVAGAGAINVAPGATMTLENNAYGEVTRPIDIDDATLNVTGTAFTLPGAITTNGNVTINTSAGLTLTGAISGDATVTKTGGGALQMLGAESNTFTGDLLLPTDGGGVTYLGKTGGAVAIPAGATIEFGTTTFTGQAYLRTIEDNQFGAGVLINFNNPWGQWSRFDMRGTDQSLAGLVTGTPAQDGGGVVQNSESSDQVRGTSVLTLTGNADDPDYPAGGYYYNGHLRDSDNASIDPNNMIEIVKNGTATQEFASGPGQDSRISFSGDLTVNGGRLIGSAVRRNASPGNWGAFGAGLSTRTITVNSGGILDFAVANMWGNHNHTNVPTLVVNGGTVTNSDAAEPDGKVNNALNNVVLNNGTLTSATGNSISTIDAGRPGEIYGAWGINGSLTSTGASTISTSSPAGVVLLGSTGADTVFDVADGTLTVSAPLQDGDAGVLANLVKSGAGTLVLSAANVYTTDTIIDEGSVALTDTGSLRFVVTDLDSTAIIGNGSITLDGSLDIDTSGVFVGTGTWTLVDTATLSETYGATFTLGTGWSENAGVWTRVTGAQTWSFTEASGELALATGTGTDSYDSWVGVGGFGLTGDDALPSADPDKDSIPNAVEMVLGGNPATVMDLALLPTIDLVTDPAGVPAGDYVLYTYRRTDLSVAAGVIAICQYDSDLTAPWLTAVHGVDGVIVLEDDDFASFNPPAAAPTDRVRVYVPRIGTDALLGRLHVTIP